jgi:hypothetical protein
LEARRMGMNGAAFAIEHFSISAVTARLIDVYCLVGVENPRPLVA